ncbi:VWA3A [Symbiodinium natans]|uniref:VWA3A protein n=1 Tax=Symbiodinium natans TaxID=878477 RepID=A0A812V760_9DINO|nr:VWA3A [Symbiodinium natans]
MPANASRSPSKSGGRGNESAARRRAYQQSESLSFGDGSPRWFDANFYIQVEHCGGIAQQSFAAFSVRLEEELYQKKAQALKEDLDSFFEGCIEVVLVEVPTLYALEVRVMREKHHPRHGSAVFGEEACAQGAKTLFSKVACKKWPKADELYVQLQEFTRIPVSFRVLCTELPPGVGATPITAEGAAGDPLFPLENLIFKVIHSTGTEHRCSTDGEGRATQVLFPAKFSLVCEEGSYYDRLDPGEIEVPSLFRPLQFVLVAKMKKVCSFEVVDHLDRPYRNFPLRLTRRKQSLGSVPLELLTKGHGRVKGRLGVGRHIASYGGTEDSSSLPVEPLSHDLEVLDIDAHQSFRICVKRCRFLCEITLRTRFHEPARGCPFFVRSGRKRLQKPLASGITSSKGVASVELPPGKLVFFLEPEGTSPYVPLQFEMQVGEMGQYEPKNYQVETKSVNVNLSLITPYGEPAPNCEFELRACFQEDGTAPEAGLSFCSDEQGQVLVALELLEPFVFSVKPSSDGSEYMPQDISFLTDRQALTIVVVRSLLGRISEDNVVFVVDASGSMQAYLEDVKSAVNLALMQQFHKTGRCFNILAFTDYQVEFHGDLVDATPKNVEAAMRFCQQVQAGGISNLAAALRLAFSYKSAEAIYLITDGESEVKEELLTQVQVQYLSHPLRPKLHTVGINCVPGGAKNRGLQRLAQLTSGRFRAPCLEQDAGEGLPPGVSKGEKVKGLDLLDNHFATTNQDTRDLLPRGGRGRGKDVDLADDRSATTDEEDSSPGDADSEVGWPGVESMFRIVGFRASGG